MFRLPRPAAEASKCQGRKSRPGDFGICCEPLKSQKSTPLARFRGKRAVAFRLKVAIPPRLISPATALTRAVPDLSEESVTQGLTGRSSRWHDDVVAGGGPAALSEPVH